MGRETSAWLRNIRATRRRFADAAKTGKQALEMIVWRGGRSQNGFDAGISEQASSRSAGTLDAAESPARHSPENKNHAAIAISGSSKRRLDHSHHSRSRSPDRSSNGAPEGLPARLALSATSNLAPLEMRSTGSARVEGARARACDANAAGANCVHQRVEAFRSAPFRTRRRVYQTFTIILAIVSPVNVSSIIKQSFLRRRAQGFLHRREC